MPKDFLIKYEQVETPNTKKRINGALEALIKEEDL